MLNYLMGLLAEMWMLLSEMAPYLLFGFLVAGMLHVFIPERVLYRHLSSPKFISVIKASLFGVPLPLCSCGVIPVAAHLKNRGASKGAVVSFLSSTPTTGVDSILATYSLMGPIFAIVRPIAAFLSGIFSGLLTIFLNNDSVQHVSETKEPNKENKNIKFIKKIYDLINYGFYVLPKDIGNWLIIGIVVGGVISYVIPVSLFEKLLGSPYFAYPIMLLVGIPMYVCATGSIPIAAALIAKGMTPGAAMVFLIAGPATNTATISFVTGKLGKKTLAAYLISIIIVSVLSGISIDLIWQHLGASRELLTGSMQMLPQSVKSISSIILLVIIILPRINGLVFKKKSCCEK